MRTHTVYNILKKSVHEDKDTIQTYYRVENNGEQISIYFHECNKEISYSSGKFTGHVVMTDGNKYIVTGWGKNTYHTNYHFVTVNEDTIDVWAYEMPSLHYCQGEKYDESAPHSFHDFLGRKTWEPLH